MSFLPDIPPASAASTHERHVIIAKEKWHRIVVIPERRRVTP